MKIMTKKALFAALLLTSGYLQAATVTWDDADKNALQGDTFTLNIVGADFLVDVDGGGVNLAFDSSVVNVLSVTIDEAVWDLGVGISGGTIDNVAGTVDGIMVNNWNTVTNDFIVATVEFEVVGTNEMSSALTLTEYVGNPWAGGGSALNPTFVAGNINVVPVPAAAWLFGSAIGLLGWLRRRSIAA